MESIKETAGKRADGTRDGGFRIKWRVRTKIIALSATFLGLLCLLATVLIGQLLQIGAEVHGIAAVDLPLLHRVGHIERHTLAQHVFVEKALRTVGGEAAVSEAAVREALRGFEGEAEILAQEFSAARSLASDGQSLEENAVDFRGIASLLDAFATEHREFEENARRLIRAAQAGKAPSSTEYEELERLAGSVEAHADDISESVARLTKTASFATEEREKQAVTIGSIILAAAASIGLVFSFLLTRSMSRALEHVVRCARRFAQGDLSVDRIPFSTSDEFGEMATSFNVMVEDLRDQVQQTRSASAAISAATSDIAASASQQAKSLKEQAATVQEVSSTLEEISRSGAQMSERARQVSDSAREAKDVSASGLEAAEESDRAMDSIREQIETVANNIVVLSEKAQAVSQIIESVSDIAEQSNLLALNAAIEAASAGEQGSRFSVVASEIKNLADQAKESTSQVSTILSDIQKGINSSVMLTEEAVKRAETGKGGSVTTERTIRELAATMRGSFQVLEQVIAGTNQQHIGVDQVTQGMTEHRAAAEQSARATAQLEGAAESLNDLGARLEAVVGRFNV